MKSSEIEGTDVSQAVGEVVGEQVVRTRVAEFGHPGVNENDHQDPHDRGDRGDEREATGER